MPRKTVYPRLIGVRLTEHLADRVEALAEEEGRSPAEWIRERVRLAVLADAKKRQRAAEAGR